MRLNFKGLTKKILICSYNYIEIANYLLLLLIYGTIRDASWQLFWY